MEYVKKGWLVNHEYWLAQKNRIRVRFYVICSCIIIENKLHKKNKNIKKIFGIDKMALNII